MTEEQTDKLIYAIESIAGGHLHGPTGLEGVAMALAGQQLHYDVGSALHAVASALERIANAMEAANDQT